ncbi:energy-coupling factor transporter ATP-binding protein EcfA1 [Clostridia bacterium]|nr:energy-coupling factor transporter ATP-binding protein EcfA1 [Clostridia bacterium]
MDDIIKIENVTFEYARYDDDKKVTQTYRALNNVSLSIEKGDFVAVLGHNGSGKSTLAKLINALLVPKNGKIYVNGMDTADSSEVYKIRRMAGMVFQNPDNQIIANIVSEDVAFGPENLALPPPIIKERVYNALESVNMTDYADSPPHFLSGGQKQRVAIAGVLAMSPEIIILDEPTAMLDPVGRNDVMETVTRLNRERGITIILITHFMEEAARANRVIVMDDGECVLDDTPRAVFSNTERLRELSLDVPQMSELADMLRKEGLAIHEGVLTVSDMVVALNALKNDIKVED